MTTRIAVDVQSLSKRYGDTIAAADVSFEVRQGEIFGVLGPNGAGKTTVIECLATLRRPDRGRVRVLGLDPQRDARALRPRIGVQLQSAALQERIKLWEALDLFASFYRRARDWRALLTQLGLAESADIPFGRLSGGQKQRAFIGLALINQPEVVFLDELTTSLDPHARHAIWNLVQEIREQGVTVFLTTHVMEEAERLCDRVAILSRGRIVALDSPQHLVRVFGVGCRISFSAPEPFDVRDLAAVAGVDRVERVGERVIVQGRSDGLVADIVGSLTAMGVRCMDLRAEQATLEDVFIELTGETLRETRTEEECEALRS
ncbi:MAG: ABC transporter ATP-binding protein [Deltaproteobacteria bacterium]|nr:ABC transporter ATP-binding protein [Deltaproteobacteria bacterium]